MKKSVLTLTLLSLAITLFTACGNKAKPVAPAKNAQNTEAAAVEDEADMAPDFELPNLQGATTKL